MSEPLAITENVRSAYVIFDEDEIAFDVWLAKVKADAWIEGHFARNNLLSGDMPANPYRGEPDE